jgi:transcriptional regulator with XRE-family HTH domain
MKGSFEDARAVRPDGLTIRRLRRDRGWSRRDLLEAIAESTRRESGVRETISPNLLEGVEETNEAIPYAILCQIASGLDCEPIELLLESR